MNLPIETIVYRLSMLIKAGYVRRTKEGKYVLTKKGKDFVMLVRNIDSIVINL